MTIENKKMKDKIPKENIIFFKYLIKDENNSVSSIFFLKINFLPNFYSYTPDLEKI